MSLRVIRLAVGGNYTAISTSAPGAATGGIDTFDTRQPVLTGDYIGISYSLGTDLAASNTSSPTATGNEWNPDVPDGTTAPPNGTLTGELFYNADVEPDADNDGFGDETQDGCVGQSGPEGGCPTAAPPDTNPPNTSITGQPKAKTKKKQATFEFTSTEPGSSFECSLNGASFTSCTSPLALKGKKGKNSFAVRAKDAAGNVDPTPATFDWKVKKKKKKKKS